MRAAAGALVAAVLGLLGPAAARADSGGKEGQRDEAGFRQTLEPRDWQFPRDHGRHDDYRTEWWYFTGNLSTDDGRDFGYQVTFFRRGLSPEPPDRRSPWATHALYFAHAHISDIQAQRYQQHERLARGRPGLAHAARDNLDVTLLGWSAKLDPATDTIHVEARDDGFAIDLSCRIVRGPIFQGPGGLSPKSDKPGYGSHYYSLTRLQTHGTLKVDGTTHRVRGLAWMDHEFSTQQLDDEQVGWDWFSLQFHDGSDLMVYQLRGEDGGMHFGFATHVSPDGEVRHFDRQQIQLTPSDSWTSPDTGATYPRQWRVQVADLTTLTVVPRFAAQEMTPGDTAGIAYYEGAVRAYGPQGDVVAQGYLEMTGYDQPLGGSF